jgi:hypothetical protein
VQPLGERLIDMGNFNDNVIGNPIASFFESLNLIELILLKHGKKAPTTFANGSQPIDGIFGSRELAPLYSGYSAISWGTSSDHRLLWVDIDEAQALNLEPIPYWKPCARRLKLDDQKIVAKFVESRRAHAMQNNLLSRTTNLQQLLTTDNYDREAADSEAQIIDCIRLMGIQVADHQCRKLPMGSISWKPALTKILYHIRYYKLVCASLVGIRKVQKTRKLADINEPITDLASAQSLLAQSFVRFNAYK